jgi:membrane associated rhomboid family serine protease
VSNWAQHEEYETRSFGFGMGRITYAVQWLILANIVVFVGQLILDIPAGSIDPRFGILAPPGGDLVKFWLAFRPDMLFKGAAWQPVTYMFLHTSLRHLFVNMLGLFFFGPEVERILSTRQFFRFYFLCGVVGVLANLIPWALLPNYSIPVVGASGATLGVLVAFAVVYPNRRVFLFPLPFPLTARALVIIFIAFNIVSLLTESGVSVLTHFGGMATGYAYMKLMPGFNAWLDSRRGPRRKKSDIDATGEAVDNILRFRDKKQRRQ